jgi:cytochrome c5
MSFRRSASTSHESPGVKILASTAVAVLVAVSAKAAAADESRIHLKEGPDVANVRAACSVCHSLDYIEMNSQFLKRTEWEAEVRKMIKVMGAPIPEADVPRIVDYLTRNYGVE